jgi:hypothetical protein
MEAGDALHPLRQAAPGETLAVLILDVHVVVGLSPVHPNKDHLAPLGSTGTNTEPEDPSSHLMDQCSRHDIPPAVTGTSPTSRGTI